MVKGLHLTYGYGGMVMVVIPANALYIPLINLKTLVYLYMYIQLHVHMYSVYLCFVALYLISQCFKVAYKGIRFIMLKKR